MNIDEHMDDMTAFLTACDEEVAAVPAPHLTAGERLVGAEEPAADVLRAIDRPVGISWKKVQDDLEVLCDERDALAMAVVAESLNRSIRAYGRLGREQLDSPVGDEFREELVYAVERLDPLKRSLLIEAGLDKYLVEVVAPKAETRLANLLDTLANEAPKSGVFRYLVMQAAAIVHETGETSPQPEVADALRRALETLRRGNPVFAAYAEKSVDWAAAKRRLRRDVGIPRLASSSSTRQE